MSAEVQKRPRFKPIIPVLDRGSEQRTITIGKAMKSAKLAGFSEEFVSRVKHEEQVGKYLKQYNPCAVVSANIKNNADACAAMIATCDAELANVTGDDEAAQKLRVDWQKVKSTYMKMFHTATVDYWKVSRREMAQEEDEKPRVPSFPANANVSAPVMAQQVNVVVHQHEKE